MSQLINKTSRAIFIGDLFLIPGKPVEAGDIDALQKKFPRLKELIDDNEVIIALKAKTKDPGAKEPEIEGANLGEDQFSPEKVPENNGLDRQSNRRRK